MINIVNFMKKIYIFAALLSGLLLSYSCQKDGLSDGYDRFTACHDCPGTRTVLDGLTPMWTPSDKISVYDGKNNLFTAEISSPAAVATFKGKLEGQARKDFMAASPYSETVKFQFLSKTVYDMVLPSEQKAVKDGYDPDAMLAVSYTQDRNLAFRNVCSLVKFTIACDGVTSVEIKSNGEEPLSGKFNASWIVDGDPKLTPFVNETQPSVVLKGDFEKGATYYISTLPAVLEGGFTVILNGSVETMGKTLPISLSRSGMVNLGSISLNPKENVEPETPSDPDEGDSGDGQAALFPATKDAVTFYVEGDYWHLYIWGEDNKPFCYPWHGKTRDDYVEIDGKSYAKFVYTSDKPEKPEANVNYDILGAVGKKIQCIVIKDGYNPSGTQTGDSDKFTLTSVVVIKVENKKPVVVQAL